MKSKVQLVQTITSDELVLSGLFSSGDTSKSAVIFIHGFTSDFYTHPFYHEIADAIASKQQGFMLAQNRGTGIETEVTRSNGAIEYIGSYFEKLEDAHLDISAWIEFLKSLGYRKIILMGHSLGTIKAVRYLFEGKYKEDIEKLILLAPFDKNSYVEKKTDGGWLEHGKIAQKFVDEGKGRERIPDTFDDFPMSYQTYFSWYKDDELGRMFDFYNPKYDFPVLSKITIPVKVIVGDKDDVLYMPEFNGSADEVGNILQKKIKKSKVNIIKGANHTFSGKEQEVVNEVITFLEEEND